MDLTQRPRRLRGSETLRRMVRETRISKASLIYPAFVAEGLRERQEIAAMPGQYRHTQDSILRLAEELLEAGVDKMLLFGIPMEKDPGLTGLLQPRGGPGGHEGPEGPVPGAVSHRRCVYV